MLASSAARVTRPLFARGLASATPGLHEAPQGSPFWPGQAPPPAVGFYGLGRMGSGMVHNLLAAGVKVHAFDVDPSAVASVAEAGAVGHSSPSGVLEALAEEGGEGGAYTPLVSMLPNDGVAEAVFLGPDSPVLGTSTPSPLLHISCSTISPAMSTRLHAAHSEAGQGYVGAPVFARPDGVQRQQATFVMGGADAEQVQAAAAVLGTSSGVGQAGATSSGLYYFGPSPGAGNVVKLCGNFLIACTIEGLSEATAFADNSGVDREAVVSMLTSTIFDCLIYKGYGQRVGERDHRPGGFALDLGKKDVSLVLSSADAVGAPMPFASVLRDRYISAQAAGWGDFDWSAIGLKASADAGVDVSAHVARTQLQVKEEEE